MCHAVPGVQLLARCWATRYWMAQVNLLCVPFGLSAVHGAKQPCSPRLYTSRYDEAGDPADEDGVRGERLSSQPALEFGRPLATDDGILTVRRLHDHFHAALAVGQ
jgi:hypothetical protein